MPERFAVYRYPAEPDAPDSAPRFSFAPLEGVGAGGRSSPLSDGEAAQDVTEETTPFGHLEAPAGSHIADVEPPVLEIPGHGRIDVASVIGATEGHASGDHLLRWHPAG